MSGIYKVDRKVDTVILEMDIDVAERLALVLGVVVDQTEGFHSGVLDELFEKMTQVQHPVTNWRGEVRHEPHVRYPSELAHIEAPTDEVTEANDGDPCIVLVDSFVR